MNRRITIEDVAKGAGVSKVTVSYVLNGQSAKMGISTPTAARVREVATNLGYRANAIARSLSTRKTDTLAVLFQSGSYFSAWSGFTSEVMRGVTEACYEEGFDVMLHTKAAANADDEAAALDDGRVDGVLILRDEDDETFIKLVERRLPCVQFFTHSDRFDVPSVDCNNLKGGQIATDHLIELGHRKIGMIAGSPKSVSSNERISGYRQSLTAAGFEFHPEWVIASPSRETIFAAVLDMLQTPLAPTAFFVWSDDAALALMRDLRTEGVRVPDDVSIIGFDSLASAELADPPLTSVRQPIRRMAAEATRMLAQLVKGTPLPIKQVLLDPLLDRRESTAPLQTAVL